VTFCLILHRDLEPDPRGLEGDNLYVVGHVRPVRMVIALDLFERIFARSLTTNQARCFIIGESGTCSSTPTRTVSSFVRGGRGEPALDRVT